MHVFLDFETRSLQPIEFGAWKYASHWSTLPLMLAARWEDDDGNFLRRLQWLYHKHGDECPEWVKEIAADDGLTVHAHNANFEIAVWRRCLVERWKWPDIPTDRWVDTAGLAAHANMPRSLKNVGKALDIKHAKSDAGKDLIRLMSIPQRVVKKTKDDDGNVRKDSEAYIIANAIDTFKLDPDGPDLFWHEHPADLKKFAAYNERDVEAEAEVNSKLPAYSGPEQRVWELDSIINERGLPIDVELCQAAIHVFDTIYNEAEIRIQHLTGGEIKKPSQAGKMVTWLNRRINFGKSLGKDFVEGWLERLENPKTQAEEEAKEMLLIRQVYGGAAIKKFQAALDAAEADHRARGQFYYYKASTGRWAGRGIQPHNFFREGIPAEEVFDLVKAGHYAPVKEYADKVGKKPAELIRSCVRGLIKAPEGSKLVVSDFAGIESRVLQWLAGAEDALDIFRAGRDMYVHTAARMYGLDYAEMMGDDGKVKKEFKEHRQIGKAAVLGLGYQMGAGRFSEELAKQGIEADAEDIVTKWRKANPKIADWEFGLWRRIERAAKYVVGGRTPGHGGTIDGKLRVTWEDWEVPSLTVELPSGRKLYYPEAELVDSDFGPKLRYKDGGKMTVDTYGGKLVENVVQAISRDLLVNSLFLADERGLYIIGHVHDEIIVETKDEDAEAAFAALHDCMTTVPTWAAGLPLEAETYTSTRYTK